jgi:formylglycine-generating enzyme required for sulfatase activity
MKTSSAVPRSARAPVAVLLLALAAVLATRESSAAVPPGAPKAGSSFRDCPACPEMVVLPPGRYVMGSTDEERRALGVPERFDRMETPRHEVTIGYSFAVGRYSVTFDEWDACVADGGCNGYRPPDEGWGRGRRPVIHVNFADAQSYVDWIRRRTGQPYRLLSEAEWEYAARGGTQTWFFWGNEIDPSRGNYGALRDRTTEVGSFPPNGFGLYDMAGNSAQWTQDCHHESYDGAPTDGSAWLTGDCKLRNVRGAGWSLAARALRAGQRIGDPPAQRNSHLGFRVARDLPR